MKGNLNKCVDVSGTVVGILLHSGKNTESSEESNKHFWWKFYMRKSLSLEHAKADKKKRCENLHIHTHTQKFVSAFHHCLSWVSATFLTLFPVNDPAHNVYNKMQQ